MSGILKRNIHILGHKTTGQESQLKRLNKSKCYPISIGHVKLCMFVFCMSSHDVCVSQMMNQHIFIFVLGQKPVGQEI